MGKYIREGSENPAILEITLLNEGPDAFKPAEYGKRIIVQRTISKTGSTYRLLSRDRKVQTQNEISCINFNIICRIFSLSPSTVGILVAQ